MTPNGIYLGLFVIVLLFCYSQAEKKSIVSPTDDCSLHGQNNNGLCICNGNYTGRSCQYGISQLDTKECKVSYDCYNCEEYTCDLAPRQNISVCDYVVQEQYNVKGACHNIAVACFPLLGDCGEGRRERIEGGEPSERNSTCPEGISLLGSNCFREELLERFGFFMIVTAALTVFSVGFELLVHFLEHFLAHHHQKGLLGIVHGFKSELTLIGLIGLTLFIVNSGSGFEHLLEVLQGSEEVIEGVHFLMFFFVIIYFFVLIFSLIVMRVVVSRRFKKFEHVHTESLLALLQGRNHKERAKEVAGEVGANSRWSARHYLNYCTYRKFFFDSARTKFSREEMAFFPYNEYLNLSLSDVVGRISGGTWIIWIAFAFFFFMDVFLKDYHGYLISRIIVLVFLGITNFLAVLPKIRMAAFVKAKKKALNINEENVQLLHENPQEVRLATTYKRFFAFGRPNIPVIFTQIALWFSVLNAFSLVFNNDASWVYLITSILLALFNGAYIITVIAPILAGVLYGGPKLNVQFVKEVLKRHPQADKHQIYREYVTQKQNARAPVAAIVEEALKDCVIKGDLAVFNDLLAELNSQLLQNQYNQHNEDEGYEDLIKMAVQLGQQEMAIKLLLKSLNNIEILYDDFSWLKVFGMQHKNRSRAKINFPTDLVSAPHASSSQIVNRLKYARPLISQHDFPLVTLAHKPKYLKAALLLGATCLLQHGRPENTEQLRRPLQDITNCQDFSQLFHCIDKSKKHEEPKQQIAINGNDEDIYSFSLLDLPRELFEAIIQRLAPHALKKLYSCSKVLLGEFKSMFDRDEQFWRQYHQKNFYPMPEENIPYRTRVQRQLKLNPSWRQNKHSIVAELTGTPQLMDENWLTMTNPATDYTSNFLVSYWNCHTQQLSDITIKTRASMFFTTLLDSNEAARTPKILVGGYDYPGIYIKVIGETESPALKNVPSGDGFGRDCENITVIDEKTIFFPATGSIYDMEQEMTTVTLPGTSQARMAYNPFNKTVVTAHLGNEYTITDLRTKSVIPLAQKPITSSIGYTKIVDEHTMFIMGYSSHHLRSRRTTYCLACSFVDLRTGAETTPIKYLIPHFTNIATSQERLFIHTKESPLISSWHLPSRKIEWIELPSVHHTPEIGNSRYLVLSDTKNVTKTFVRDYLEPEPDLTSN